MTPFFTIYIIAWGIACAFCVILLFKERAYYADRCRSYFRYLIVPWRVSTFLIAGIGMIVVAPYTGDPTWDYVDAGFMSVFTFISAPWAVGALYRVSARKLPIKHGFIAFCAWMFSASWSYDLYLLIRDGYYPYAWFTNIFASSVLYISAGLFWGLDWREGKGITLSFMEEDWPYPSTQMVFMKIVWFALPFMVIASGIVLYFFIHNR